MNILFVAAEVRPFAVVGGLGDVIGALPKALRTLGHDVRIVMPKYRVIDEKKFPLERIASSVTVPFAGATEMVDLYQTSIPDTDVPVYFIDHPIYLGENGVYFQKDASSDGSRKEMNRFLFFTRAALEVPDAIHWTPAVIHAHDWHVGLLPLLAKLDARSHDRYRSTKTLFTIHNLGYQGWYRPDDALAALHLSEQDWPTLSKRAGEHGDLNSIQQGILNADAITTVSPTYAREILTPEYGAGLEQTLTQRHDVLTGILNGIDVERFNPATDPHLIEPYTADNRAAGKATCKRGLQRTVGLPERPDVPLIGIVSRMAEQKGVDLAAEALRTVLGEVDAQFVVLGTGSEKEEALMRALDSSFPDKARALIDFNVPLSQKIYAGADMFLIPSRYEPCGLTQMIAMRYGTIPIVRATGGLKDTVAEYDPATGEGDGFVFGPIKASALADAVRRALVLYATDRKAWDALVQRGMERDFSWEVSAAGYGKLYEKLIH